MATTSPASPTPTPAAADQPDWPAQAADAIVEQVGKVRDRTTGPAIKISGYVVFGAFATLLGTVAFILFLIGAFRVLDAYLPDAVFGDDHTWAAHTILGAILVLAGLFTSRKMKGDNA
ncbi:MAG TPA: hypothetical protein VLR27_07525 [Acidimicrobiales bacterium]|nr:hypothetical protein [Acidimicrobiales bacterium]